jgi:anti-sigma factor RsiW
MRCKTVRDKLDRFVRQELAPRMRDRVEAHLKDCAGCRRHLAWQERLATLLAGPAEPPSVPEGFSDRLMAAARQRQAACRPVPGSLWRLRWLSPSGTDGHHARHGRLVAVGQKAAQAVALAGGLLIGVLMGQQTWQLLHPSMAQQNMQPDPVAVYQLDYLTEAPGGSLAQSYLTLTSVCEP